MGNFLPKEPPPPVVLVPPLSARNRKETVVNVCGFLDNSCFSVCGFLDKEWSRDECREAKNPSNIGSNQGSGPPPVLVKAEVPWSAKRGALLDKDRVLKSVKGILNKLTPEKYELLKGQLIDSGITSPDILEGVIQLILRMLYCSPHSVRCMLFCVVISMAISLRFHLRNPVGKK